MRWLLIIKPSTPIKAAINEFNYSLSVSWTFERSSSFFRARFHKHIATKRRFYLDMSLSFCNDYRCLDSRRRRYSDFSRNVNYMGVARNSLPFYCLSFCSTFVPLIVSFDAFSLPQGSIRLQFCSVIPSFVGFSRTDFWTPFL